MRVKRYLPTCWRLFAPVLLASASLILWWMIARAGPADLPLLYPKPNSHTALPTTTLSVDFSNAIDPASISTRTLPVFGRQQGLLTGTYQVSGSLVEFIPDSPLFPGEIVHASLTTHTRLLSGTALALPLVWQFRTAASPSPASFAIHPSPLDSLWSVDVALGDLDSDGDLDIFLAHRDHAATVWLNDGFGIFSTDQIDLGSDSVIQVTLGDLDGDGDLDAIQAGIQEHSLWWNDGEATFTYGGSLFPGTAIIQRVALGDLDGDGDLDALTVSACDGFDPDQDCLYARNRLWWNDGRGGFSAAAQTLGHGTTIDLALGDLDLDGDLDAVFGRPVHSSAVWTNLGSGVFTSTQSLPDLTTDTVDLGDLDGDGDLDVLFSPQSATASAIWLNDGSGYLSPSQSLGILGHGVLGDLDGDGDLDALSTYSHRLWRNQGDAIISPGEFLPTVDGDRSALGDLDGDGDVDIVAVRSGAEPGIWINQTLALFFIPLLLK